MITDSAAISEFMRMHPDVQLLAVDHKNISISNKISEMGIWVCQSCSRMNNVERMHCKYCSTEKFILVEHGFSHVHPEIKLKIKR